MVKEFELGKTETFSGFSVGNISAMRLLRRFGLLRQPGEPRDKKARGFLEGKERSFRNIAEHCVVVGMVTDVIFASLEKQGKITRETRRKGVKAAILHDLTKRQELEASHGINSIAEARFINPEEERNFINQLLDEHDISSQDRETLSLSGLTGGNVLFLPPDEKINLGRSPEDLIRWTIFLTDYMVANDLVVSPENRIAEVTERIISQGEYSQEVSWWYKRLFGEEAFIAAQQSQGKREIINAINNPIKRSISVVEHQLQDMLGIGDTSILDFVQQNIQERYQESS